MKKKVIKLKIKKCYYDEVKKGNKTFEIRYDDRGYQKGDVVILEPIDDKTEEFIEGYGCIHATIGFVSAFQQKDNWVVFSLLDIRVWKERQKF